MLSYDAIRAVRSTKINPALLTYYRRPLLMVRGERQFLFDDQGKRYLDMFGGIVTVSVGHCHP